MPQERCDQILDLLMSRVCTASTHYEMGLISNSHIFGEVIQVYLFQMKYVIRSKIFGCPDCALLPKQMFSYNVEIPPKHVVLLQFLHNLNRLFSYFYSNRNMQSEPRSSDIWMEQYFQNVFLQWGNTPQHV
ncbi:hypothetical protein HHI36_018962 [Cryptolaemus montrouzieri]|uniref:Uncharacterized protein n=1 Tax=Cryptolaemus montrouzieri TaxID=559131 RepID=A0ABD2P1T9_9CUCU